MSPSFTGVFFYCLTATVWIEVVWVIWNCTHPPSPPPRYATAALLNDNPLPRRHFFNIFFPSQNCDLMAVGQVTVTVGPHACQKITSKRGC